MIGNIGGYVGLLLGFSILQAMNMLLRFFDTKCKHLKQILTKKFHNDRPNSSVNSNIEVLPTANLDSPPENVSKTTGFDLEMTRVNNRFDCLEELILGLEHKINDKLSTLDSVDHHGKIKKQKTRKDCNWVSSRNISSRP